MVVSMKLSPKVERLPIVPGIAATFVGTVVGAGFASGKEIFRFFTIQGLQGCLGVFCSILILGFFGERVFRIGLAIRPKSYKEFFEVCLGPALSRIADLIVSVFFVILIGVMFAGCGAIFEELGFGYWIGIALSALIVMMILFKELSGLITANLIIVPLMFCGALTVSLFAIQNRCAVSLWKSADFNWLLAAVQYSSYNLVLAVPVLLSLCRRYPSASHLKLGGWLGSLTLGAMAGLIYWSLIFHFPHLRGSQLPMVDLARLGGDCLYWMYALILWCEMLTTLLANTYGVAQRLAASTGLKFRSYVIILTIIGILIGQIGFGKLVTKFYPLFGYFCLAVLLLLIKKIPAAKK